MVTRLQLAAELGLNPRYVSKLLEEGLPIQVRGKGGRASMFDLSVCRAWLEARNRVDEPAVDGVSRGLTAERARKERAQALLAEQLYAVRSGKLLDAETVEKRWAAEITAARSVILSSYTTAADRVFRAGTIDGLVGVERELKAIAYGVLRELSRETAAPTAQPKKPKKPKKRKAAARC